MRNMTRPLSLPPPLPPVYQTPLDSPHTPDYYHPHPLYPSLLLCPLHYYWKWWQWWLTHGRGAPLPLRR